MTKIIYIVTQGEMGGAQRYVFNLATHFGKNEYEILALLGPENQDLKVKLDEAGIKTQIAKNLVRNINPVSDLLAVFELRKIFRHFKPDIIHLNSSKAGVLGSIAAKLAKISNVVFTAHGFAFLEPNSKFVNRFYFWAEKITTKYRKKIIAVSDHDRISAINAGLCEPEKLITIHNGINAETCQFFAKEEAKKILTTNYKLPAASFIIGTIANLYATKGINYLIEAARKILSDQPDVKFVVVGEGNQRKYLESAIGKYRLENNFFLLGKIENASQYLKAFDVFVLPSVKEGFPFAILEAMVAGLPIVATKVGGIPEVLQHGKDGILVAPQDPIAISDAVEKLINDQKFARDLGQNAQQKIKGFTLDLTLAKTEAVYQDLLLRGF